MLCECSCIFQFSSDYHKMEINVPVLKIRRWHVGTVGDDLGDYPTIIKWQRQCGRQNLLPQSPWSFFSVPLTLMCYITGANLWQKTTESVSLGNGLDWLGYTDQIDAKTTWNFLFMLHTTCQSSWTPSLHLSGIEGFVEKMKSSLETHIPEARVLRYLVKNVVGWASRNKNEKRNMEFFPLLFFSLYLWLIWLLSI